MEHHIKKRQVQKKRKKNTIEIGIYGNDVWQYVFLLRVANDKSIQALNSNWETLSWKKYQSDTKSYIL